MPEITTVPLPFAQGLTQQTDSEWQDPNASASLVLNGNFTKQGAVDKRLGLEFLSNNSTFLVDQGSQWVGPMATGIQPMTWSKCAFGASGLDSHGLAALYSMLDDGSGNIGIGPLPPPSVLRRGLPAATTAAAVGTTPSLVDVTGGSSVARFAFYVSGTTTWMVVINADTNDLIRAPVQVYNAAPTTIQAIYLPNAPAASAVVVMLYFAGSPGSVVGLYFSATGVSSGSAAFGPINVQTADIGPYVNDPAGGFIFAYDVPNGDFNWTYFSSTWTELNSGAIEGIKAVTGLGLMVAANYGAGELVAFFYEYQTSTPQALIRYASLTGDHTFTPVTAPETLVAFTPSPVPSLSGFSRVAPATFAVSFFQLNPVGSSQITVPSGVLGTITSGTFASVAYLPTGCYPVAKMFVVGSVPYQPVILQLNATSFTPTIAENASEQCTLYLMQYPMLVPSTPDVDTMSALPVATVAPRQVDPSFSTFVNNLPVPPPFCSALTGTRFAVGLKTQAEDYGTQFLTSNVFQSLGAAWSAEFRFDLQSQNQHFQVFEVYGGGHISAGVPMICDGTQVYEHTFFYYPEFASAAVALSGQGYLFGTYTYAVVYKYFDATGQLARGSPVFTEPVATEPQTLVGVTVNVIQGSNAITFSTSESLNGGTVLIFGAQPDVTYSLADPVTGTSGLLTTPYTGTSDTTSTVQIAGYPLVLTFPPLSMTYRDLANPGQVYAEIYRDSNTDGVSSGTFYLVTEIPCEGQGTQVTFTDLSTDADIITNTILYTTGGVLDCVNPPSFYCETLHWNRIWGVDDTRRVIWFTKTFTPGEVPGYNEALTISYPSDITGLWSMDDKLLIGSLAGIAILYGQGPADNGQGSDLTLPQPIACDAGPVDWRAGVVFPGGFIYRSQTGFMLCDRSLNVSWIGKDVVDLLAVYSTVLSATLVPTATQVRFICENIGSETITLVYDYLSNKWLEHTYITTGGIAGVLLTGTTPEHPSGYGLLAQDGGFWQEHQPTDTTAYQDDLAAGGAVFVPTYFSSAWVKIQGVQGYQQAGQVQFLFEERDDCGVGMYFEVNYQNGPVQSYTWPSLVIDELPLPVVMQHVGAQYNKQMSIRVTVFDVPGTEVTTGRGARFVGLSLALRKLGDTFRQVPAAGRA